MNHKERLLTGFVIYSLLNMPVATILHPAAGVFVIILSYIVGAIADGLGKNPLNKLISTVRD